MELGCILVEGQGMAQWGHYLTNSRESPSCNQEAKLLSHIVTILEWIPKIKWGEHRLVTERFPNPFV